MELSAKILSEVTTYMKYSKYLPSAHRRETWDEIVDRYESTMINKYPKLAMEIVENAKYIRDKKILPSMRFLQFSGRPVELNNVRGYNCSALPIDDIRAFSEVMFLLLSGTGVGFSVQQHHVKKLPNLLGPKLPCEEEHAKRYLIGDSIEG